MDERPRRRALLSFATLSAPLVATISVGCGGIGDPYPSSVCNVVCDDSDYITSTGVAGTSTTTLPPDPDSTWSTTAAGTSATSDTDTEASGTDTEASGTDTGTSATDTGTSATDTGTSGTGTGTGTTGTGTSGG